MTKMHNTALIALASFLTLSSVACTSENTDSIATPSPVPSAIPASPAPEQPTSAASTPLPTASVAGRDPYNEAIDLASSAINFSKSAAVREDWAMVASRWQQAVDYLQTVPNSHQKYAEAQAKIPQYQRFLAEAQLKSKPPEQATADASGDVNPKYFTVPIKQRISGIPLVEVNFNGVQKFDMLFDTGASKTLLSGPIAATLNLKPVATSRVVIADGSVVELPIVAVDSMEINGRVKRKVSSAVAPNMPVGLLGQDFFEGYDFTIKKNVIEFNLR
ncbi:MAG: retroviral-like aspartic protease family protein [Cyanobacteriota bacterium]|nr:retroviral-like aspartic protease family protein [Cyanobacteriota bacterium]